jgi:mono/diheme cytochrome c family protein
MHLDREGGGFDPRVYEPFVSYKQVAAANPDREENLAELGRELYTTKGCIACHQANGAGLPGQFPPLAESEWVTTEGTARLIRIVLNSVIGEISVKGQTYNNPGMPPWRDILTDKEIAAILSFIRQEWGNKAGPVSAPQVKTIRELTADRTTPYSAADLLAIPATE